MVCRAQFPPIPLALRSPTPPQPLDLPPVFLSEARSANHQILAVDVKERGGRGSKRGRRGGEGRGGRIPDPAIISSVCGAGPYPKTERKYFKIGEAER